MTEFDPRVTAARDDLAAEELRGKVPAPRFAKGVAHTIIRGRTALRANPSEESRRENELLFGEIFTVYDEKDGWAWGQSGSDRYVGYISASDCAQAGVIPDHRVVALATPLLPEPDVKRPPRDMLPLNAKVKVVSRGNGFAHIARSGYVAERHVEPLSFPAADWVAVAERFLRTPYVWGGKTWAGLDCSGLVQTALEAAGIACPRDTDQQEEVLGARIGRAEEMPALLRGDLMFWNGHVGIMRDEATLLHANAFHMEVASEPVAEALRRIVSVAGPVTSVRRLAPQ